MEEGIKKLEELVALQEKMIDKQKSIINTYKESSACKDELISLMKEKMDAYEKFFEELVAKCERSAA